MYKLNFKHCKYIVGYKRLAKNTMIITINEHIIYELLNKTKIILESFSYITTYFQFYLV